jgi:hypothetical protein
MTKIGRDKLIVIAPAIEMIRGNAGEPIAKEGSAKCLAGFSFLQDPFRLFHAEIEPPLAQQGPPMDARAFRG